MLFEEHCVIFYAKFVIDDQVGSRMMRQQLREAIKRVFTGHLVEDTGWRVH